MDEQGRQRTILLGLDGFSKHLLKLDECSYIRKLYEENSSGTLKSIIPIITGAAWATISTGKTPGNHGITGWMNYKEGPEGKVYTGKDLKDKRFYEILDEAGKKCFVMNIPFSDHTTLKGDIVHSWLHKRDDSKIENFIDPKNLKEKYPALKNYKVFPNRAKSNEKFLKSFKEIFKSKKEVIKQVIEENEHDFIFPLISVTDALQHKVLKDIVKGKKTLAVKEALSILEEVDEFVKWIDEHMEEDNLIIISDHGFEPYKKVFFVNDWLKEKGYLKTSLSGKETVGMAGDIFEEKKSFNLGKVAHFFRWHPKLFKIINPIRYFIQKHFNVKIVGESGIDMEKTKAYCRDSGEEGIWINREKVKGKEVKKVRNQIIKELNEVKGLNAFKKEEIYSGKNMHKVPDILLQSNEHRLHKGPSGKAVRRTQEDSHHINGVIICKGKKFKKSTEIKEAALIDVGPTVLHMNKMAVPKDMDGDVLKKPLKKPGKVSYTKKAVKDTEKEKIKSKIKSMK